MSWRDFLTSRLELHLGEALQMERKRNEDLRFGHAADLDALDRAHKDEIADLKSAHGRELSYVIDECARLRNEVDRLRLYLVPGLQASPEYTAAQSREQSGDAPPSRAAGFGTPWQRILARELEEQEVAAKIRHTKPAGQPVAAVAAKEN